MRLRVLSVGLCLALCVFAAPAAAQRAGEMTFFSNPGYGGSRYTVTGPRENISLPWAVRSVLIAQGENWQVCSGNRYRGDCTVWTSSERNVRRIVASARPSTITTLPAPVLPGGGDAGQSLRGMSAEFFAAPLSGGRRVVGSRSGTPAQAAEAADRFCRSRGWTASSHESLQTVGGVHYLADVLCTRTGN